ncbi:MAG: hypothetical protein KA715_06205 [Xanthomonadaceae bacterium]|nr:hypothetical protein [Xanthomonadaceae bacterium]
MFKTIVMLSLVVSGFSMNSYAQRSNNARGRDEHGKKHCGKNEKKVKAASGLWTCVSKGPDGSGAKRVAKEEKKNLKKEAKKFREEQKKLGIKVSKKDSIQAVKDKKADELKAKQDAQALKNQKAADDRKAAQEKQKQEQEKQRQAQEQEKQKSIEVEKERQKRIASAPPCPAKGGSYAGGSIGGSNDPVNPFNYDIPNHFECKEFGARCICDNPRTANAGEAGYAAKDNRGTMSPAWGKAHSFNLSCESFCSKSNKE